MTINDVLAKLPRPNMRELDAPRFFDPAWETRREVKPCLGLAVESMRRHTSDEGWQLFQGLEHAGYELCGHSLFGPMLKNGRKPKDGMTDVKEILEGLEPGTLVLQDKREWEGRTAGPGFDPRERFTNVECLKDRTDVFKLTIIKDAQYDGASQMALAQEAGIHAWVCYYNLDVVHHLNPWTRRQHLIRTWHTVDKDLVPLFSQERPGVALLSGATSEAYPLRSRLVEACRKGPLGMLPTIAHLPHPGYRRDKCCTLEFLKTLSRYKVAICTSSKYGYALRKIVEATACGCIVVTDLPEDEMLPEIDGNLVRVSPGDTPSRISMLVGALANKWNPDRQEAFAERAKRWYDLRVMGKRLALAVEDMRRSYNAQD